MQRFASRFFNATETAGGAEGRSVVDPGELLSEDLKYGLVCLQRFNQLNRDSGLAAASLDAVLDFTARTCSTRGYVLYLINNTYWGNEMSQSKLTLSADRDLIDEAKKLAAEERTSLSALFSRVLRAMTHARVSGEVVGPVTRKATGLIRLPGTAEDERLLEDALSRKYALRK